MNMFDAYYKWLGIPPNEQPPNHYRLLGLQLFEVDVEVIEAAANRQMAYIQQRATGEHAAASQKLLNELSAVRVCLLDSKKKAAYDADLKANVASSPPVTDPQGIERLLAEEWDELLQQAQQAYDQRDYEKVIELIKGRGVDDDQRFRRLLDSATFSLDEIQRLSQELDEVWRQQDGKRVTKVAEEILALQPSHLAANEALRWARSLRPFEYEPSMTMAGGKIKDEPFLRKHLALVAVVFLVAFLAGSALVYHQLATSKNTADSVAATLPAANQNERDGTTLDHPKRTRPQADLKPAIYNVEVDPPNATLTVEDNRGVITGTGRQRQIRIDHPSSSGKVVIEAVCSGYKSSEQWLKPKPGDIQDLHICLEKLGGPEPDSTNPTLSNEEKLPTKGLIQIRIFREGKWISHEVTHDKGQAFVTRFDGVKVPLRHEGDVLMFITQFGTVFNVNMKTRKSILNEPVELMYEGDKSVATPQHEPLDERLRATKWQNTNGVTFEWDATGTLLRNGKPLPYEVIDDTRIRIKYGENHIDTFVFDDDLQHFEQFSTSAPNRKPLFTGRRLN
jgi:hypothetical protein